MLDANTTAGTLGKPPSHYAGEGGIDNFAVWDAYDMDRYSANAFKYLARWDKKGSPLNDLKKARHYIEECKIRIDGRGLHRVFIDHPGILPVQVIEAFGLTGDVADAVMSLLIYRALIVEPTAYLDLALESVDRAIQVVENA